MRYRIAVLLLSLWLVALGCPSFGKWAHVPTEDLVACSGLIVVGTLQGATETSRDGMDYGQGTILVKEVLWGRAKPGDKLALRWQNESILLCPRVEHLPHQNQELVWLLTYGENGTVQADYPGRTLSLQKRDEIARILVSRPLRALAAEYTVVNTKPITMSLVYRNATDHTMSYPAFAFKNGKLHLHPKVTFSLYTWENSHKITFPLKVGILQPDPNQVVSVAPRQELRLQITLNDLYARLPTYTNVEVAAEGFGSSNPARFDVLSPEEYARDLEQRKRSLADIIRDLENKK